MVERQSFGGFNMSGVGSKSGGPDYLLQSINDLLDLCPPLGDL